VASEINSEGKINRETNRKTQILLNSINYKRNIMEQTDSRIKIMQHTVYFKLILTFNTKTWALTKRKRRKFQEMDMKYFRSIERKPRGGLNQKRNSKRSWSSKFVDRADKEIITMVWQCEKNK
jgi:hypothetical protein